MNFFLIIHKLNKIFLYLFRDETQPGQERRVRTSHSTFLVKVVQIQKPKSDVF